MSKPTTIYCPVCEEPCGREYPATGPTYESGGEPGFREGKGEDFTLNGVWYCSHLHRAVAIEESKK